MIQCILGKDCLLQEKDQHTWAIELSALCDIIHLPSDGQQDRPSRISAVIAFKAIQRDVTDLTRLSRKDEGGLSGEHVVQGLHDHEDYCCCEE